MADPIIINVQLVSNDLQRFGDEVGRKLQNALDVGLRAAVSFR